MFAAHRYGHGLQIRAIGFLRAGVSRGDDIRLLSEPSTLFGSTGFYQREIEVITQGWTKADGALVQPLKIKYNYKFNNITKSYEKIKEYQLGFFQKG